MIDRDEFSRIGKLFVDEEGVPPEEARRRLAGHRVALACGPEVAASPTLQAAVLTAANVAARCFPGAVSLHLTGGTGLAAVVPWPASSTLAEAAVASAPGLAVGGEAVPAGAAAVLVFGTRSDIYRGIQVTFDGWTAAAAPVAYALRLPERERCVLAGVAAGALAVSETFMAFAEVSVEATRRAVGLSLWRPDLPWDHADAVGVPVEYLPGEAWCLGLGHLGQAYLWCLGLLPYAEPGKVNLILNDFDQVMRANLDTGILSLERHLDRFKARVAAEWLEDRGFRPRLVERAFDEGTRRRPAEPLLGLCGFDGRGPRHLLDEAGFGVVVECGLGGRADNFDGLQMHTLPAAGRTCRQMWPEGEDDEARNRAERLARRNEFYQAVGEAVRCGHVELAGLSVAVPFVGAVAGSLVLAEALRMLHDGERYESIDVQLSSPDAVPARRVEGGYRGSRQPGLAFQQIGAAFHTQAVHYAHTVEKRDQAAP